MSHIKNNLDIHDDLKDPWMRQGVVYSGDTRLINDQAHKKKKHISPLLATAVLGLNNTGTPSPETSKYENIWTDIDAQEKYLNAKPTCYLILGKPGLGSYGLGEAISKKYHCIHLCPKNIINDEILQGSLTGKCLDFNMKHNNVCTYISILKMLKQKLKSRAVKHRGYVISGIPLVTASKEPYCLIKTKHSEEAYFNADEELFDLIYNLKRKKPKEKPLTDDLSNELGEAGEEGLQEEEEEEAKEEQEEEGAEEEDVAAELPKFLLNTCSDIFINIKAYFETRQATVLHQLQELFSLDLVPDVIIYVTCPDADVVTKKYNKYINYKTGQYTVEPFLTKVTPDTRWPTRYNLSDYENPHDIHVFNPKYNCRPPMNFKEKSEYQMCNYRHYIFPYIEKKILDYDPKHVIKLDGRTSIYQMMHQLSERLLLMDINPVIIPEPLYLEESPSDFEEFWQTVDGLKVIRSGVVSFKRCASPWLNRCPVELKRRQSVVGKPKFGVMLFKHVYVMSSLPNFISFCRNPRPYLKLKYLEPTCRFIIVGTKSSGKTMTAECLSWLFDTPVTCFKTFMKTEREKKYHIYSKTILSEIIATIEDARFMEWQQKEQDREASLKEWSESTMALLKEYIPLLKRRLQYTKENTKRVEKSLTELQEEEQIIEEGEQIKEVEEQIFEEGEQNEEVDDKQIIEEKPSLDSTFIKEFNTFRERMSFLMPILDDVDECLSILENKTVSQYAPIALTTVTQKPSLPLVGDADVSKGIEEYIVANELQKEIEPTTEEVMHEMIRALSTVDAEHKKKTGSKEWYGKYIIDGFPSAPEYWELFSDAKFLPDYTIAIMENREIDPELWHHYQSIETCVKNHHEVLLAAKDPLILCKQQTKSLPELDGVDMKMMLHEFVKYHLSKLTKSIFSFPTPEPADPDPELLASFTESIEKFREDWDSIKIKLEEKSKCFIEVELENKTDIEVLEQVLLKLRQCYYLTGAPNEDEEEEIDEDESPKNLLSYNNPQNLGETNIYCPFTYFNYGILWEGKREFSLKYDNKILYFAKEEFLEQFQKDVTKYQAYNNPFKKLPKPRICVIGCSGSGSSSIAKRIALELGLIHVDFEMVINLYSMPRHFKKVERRSENPFTDTPIEEEGVVEFQMNEENPNLLADILSNETEMRRIIFNYYERGQPILPMIMHRIIKRLWYTYPYDHTGFVIDGYPRVPQDVEDLVHCNCIPDLVIELDCSPENVVDRLGSIKFKQWKTQLKEAKEAHKVKMATEKKEWNRLITVKVVVKLIIEEIIETLEEPPTLTDSASNKSFIVDAHPTGSANLDPKLFNIYNEIIAEYPEPEDTRVWEKPDEERERIESRIEAIFETEYENIQSLKEVITDEKINTVTIDATKPFYKTLRIALSKLKNLRNRTESFFEETYIISIDIAELLLSQGICFLSKFGRLCPVSIHENPQMMLNTYKLRHKGKVFPIIHRAYVYFISGDDNVIEFRRNPLKYIISEAIKSYYPYPLRIGIIGAPKSGRSTLAAKLAKRNNLICISRGMAIRRVLDNMYWTEMGSRILKNLNNGDTINDDFILNAIQAVAIDHRTVTYGFVLDGFPMSPYEAQILAKDGLYPNIIFDLSADKKVILENSQNEVYYNILKYKPPYSYSFIENRFNEWSTRCYKIRKWINGEYDNICKMNGNESKWQCWQNAYDSIKDLTSKIHHYLANVETSIVSASAMNISHDIFKQKESKFKNMCPACLRKNILRYNGCPVDKSGIVEFKNKFYWICPEHMDIVTNSPRYYLLNEINIPELPAVVSTINTSNVHENGICVVTYGEGLPGQKLATGTNKFAATYKHKTYLFCSEQCLKKFLEKPHIYSDITIFQGSRWYPRLSLKKLPDLGYLEQTLANVLTQACCSVNAARPKYPGLGIQVSAVIYIALYLKTHNPNLPQAQQLAFQKALKLFDNRSKLILDLGLRMRSMENPFLSYPKCHHGTPKCYSPVESVKNEILSDLSVKTGQKGVLPQSEYCRHSSVESLMAKTEIVYKKSRRVPVPDERYDYLCEYHKPASKVPAFLNVVDIAGLVRGAAEGQGLGNAFLSHIKACDAIFNLCRAFDDEDVIHVDGDVNPVRDLETIGEELRLKDEEQLMQNFEKLDRVVNRGGDKKLKPEYDTLQKIKTVLVEEKKHIRFGDWSAADIEVLNKHLFLTSKPALYLVNLSEKDYIRKKNKWLPKLKEWIDKNDPGAPLIPFSGAFETKLVEMDAAERQAYLKENNLSSALDKIIVQGYKALQLEYFFTAGPDEVKAWTIQKGTKAPQAAGRIHTDFEKGFIMAEVMHFKDFKEEGTEAACKAAGKYRQQGRNYVVEDGDIIFFKFNAGAGLKDAKKK